MNRIDYNVLIKGLSVSIPLLNKNMRDINPLSYGIEKCKEGHSYGPAIREYYLIHFVLEGKGTFEKNNVTYKVEENGMFLIVPGETTFYKADDQMPWTYTWIGFDGDLAAGLLEESGFSDKQPVLNAPSARCIVDSFTLAAELKQTAEYYICSKLFELFSLLGSIKAENNSIAGGLAGTDATLEKQVNIYVRKVQDFIKTNYHKPVKVSGLASMLGIDRRYLYRIFKSYIGVSPQQYLLNTRLEKAAHLLDRKSCTVKEAAYGTGYEDVFNFSKMFKKKYGVSPGKYKHYNEA